MSLTQSVAGLIVKRGSGTVDDILPDLCCTRSQALRALKAAKATGLIDSDGWTGPRHGGSLPATYRAIKKKTRPAASVWEFAQVAAVSN